jgi:hypothetical protein
VKRTEDSPVNGTSATVFRLTDSCLRGDRGEHLLAQVDAALPGVATDQVEGLVTGEAAGEGEKVVHIVKMRPPLPPGQTGLLVDVFDVGGVGQHRANEQIQPPLMADQFGRKIEPPGAGVLRGESNGGGWDRHAAETGCETDRFTTKVAMIRPSPIRTETPAVRPRTPRSSPPASLPLLEFPGWAKSNGGAAGASVPTSQLHAQDRRIMLLPRQ